MMKLILALLLIICLVERCCGEASRKDCTAVFVRWARVRINVTPAASGSHSLATCMSLCSDGAYPSKPGAHMACAGFNYKYGSNAATSDCQFFEHGQMRNFDWYAEANDQYAFFRNHCVPTVNACKLTHQFDFYTDRYVDESLVDRKQLVDNLEACLGLCLDEEKFACRSATFNRTSSWCMLSTRSRQTHPKMVKVNNNPNYRVDYYENNCQNSSVHVSHTCQEKGIFVAAESKFPYTGAMYGLYDFFTCRVEPKEELKFQMFFPFPSEDKNCSESIVLEGDEYILDVVISLDGVKPLYFVTDQDLIYQARCPKQAVKPGSYPSATVGTALHMRPAKTTAQASLPTDMPVTVQSSIAAETSTFQPRTEAPTTTSFSFVDNSTKNEPIAFDILHNGQSVKAVVIGNKITLRFTPSVHSLPANLVLVACQIEPINSPYAWERDPLQIIRSGCQADGVGLVCPPEMSSSGVKVVMEAFRYTTTSEVLFSCLIRNCNYGPCPRPVCPSVEGCDPAQMASSWPSDVETKNVRIEPTSSDRGRFSFTDGDHVVSRQLIVVNSVHELQYFLKTGNVPSGIQSAGFFQG
uniref:Apple domain-containing protein n=1 Tax=Trichuris muris TaxID=70415 RepID=A0A5S6QZY6_TRIMR